MALCQAVLLLKDYLLLLPSSTGINMNLFLLEVIVYLGILPNWSHCVGKACDQLNDVQIYAEISASVLVNFIYFFLPVDLCPLGIGWDDLGGLKLISSEA